MISKVLAVDRTAPVGIEGRQDINRGSTGFQTGLPLCMTSRQESRKDTLVRVRPEDTRRLAGEVALMLSDLSLGPVSRLRGSKLDRVVASRD